MDKLMLSPGQGARARDEHIVDVDFLGAQGTVYEAKGEAIYNEFGALSSVDASDYKAVRDELAEKRVGVLERKLVVYHLFSNEPGHVGDRSIEPAAARKLAQRYRVDEDGFTFILLGKDGLEKLRADKAIAVERVFETIDAMPMRQREMKR